MAKIKVDLTDQDAEKNKGGSFDPLPKGVYTAKITDVTDVKTRNGNAMANITWTVQDKAFRGRLVFDRVILDLDSVKWRLDQFLQAVGLVTDKKRKITLDTADLMNKVAKLSVDISSYERDDGTTGTSNEVKRYMENDSDDVGSDPDEDDDLDGDDDDLDDEPTDDGDDDTTDDDDEVDLEMLGEQADDDDSDDQEGAIAKLEELAAEADLDTDDYDTWSDLASALAGAEGEESGDGPDYEEMDLADLRALCKERKLNSKGAKPALIKRLQDSDGDEEPF